MKNPAFIAAVRAAGWMTAPALFLLLPVSFFEDGWSICVFKNLFGFDCPGCGMLRAMSNVFHGDLGRAIGFNRAVVVVLPLLAWVFLKGFYNELGAIGLHTFKARPLSDPRS